MLLFYKLFSNPGQHKIKLIILNWLFRPNLTILFVQELCVKETEKKTDCTLIFCRGVRTSATYFLCKYRKNYIAHEKFRLSLSLHFLFRAESNSKI